MVVNSNCLSLIQIANFLSKVQITDTCWVWTANKSSTGYGKVKINYADLRAHRVSYELHKGLIPKGILVLHTCDNPSCVNPEHLELGTHEDNMKDRGRKGRTAAQSSDRDSSLTKEQVLEIRRLLTEGRHLQSALAAQFNVAQVTISRIKNRKVWRTL